MAGVASTPRSFPKRLRDTLVRDLAAGGLRAAVATERVPTTKLHRVFVTSPQFKHLSPAERQNLVWRIVRQAFGPDEQLLVSMILTLTPDEVNGTAGA